MGEIIKKIFVKPEALERISSMFYNKVRLLVSMGRISVEMELLLIEINKVRNKLAHDLSYNLDFDTLYHLLQLSVCANVDYSDNQIHTDYSYSKENYYDSDNFGVWELLTNTFYAVLSENEDLFSQDEISNFTC